MNKNIIIFLIGLILFTLPSIVSDAAYATYPHVAIKVADGKDIDLNGRSIGNGTFIGVNSSEPFWQANYTGAYAKNAASGVLGIAASGYVQAGYNGFPAIQSPDSQGIVYKNDSFGQLRFFDTEGYQWMIWNNQNKYMELYDTDNPYRVYTDKYHPGAGGAGGQTDLANESQVTGILGNNHLNLEALYTYNSTAQTVSSGSVNWNNTVSTVANNLVNWNNTYNSSYSSILPFNDSTGLVSYIAANPGRRIVLGCNNFTVASTIVISTSETTIEGCGHGGQESGGNTQTNNASTYLTQLYWTGAVGGEIIRINPDSQFSNQFIRDIDINQITLNGGNTAGTCVNATALSGSTWKFSCIATAPAEAKASIRLSGGDVGTTTMANLRANVFEVNMVQSSTAVGDGWLLTRGLNDQSDVNQNEFRNCQVAFYGKNGWNLTAADNNKWFGGYGYDISGQSKYIVYQPTNALKADGNVFFESAYSPFYFGAPASVSIASQPERIFGISSDSPNVTIANNHSVMIVDGAQINLRNSQYLAWYLGNSSKQTISLDNAGAILLRSWGNGLLYQNASGDINLKINENGSITVPNSTIVQNAWIPCVFQNGWHDYDNSTDQPCGVYRDSNGRIQLRGTIAGGSVPAEAVTLPVGYGVQKITRFASSANWLFGAGYITGRNLYVQTGSNVWFTLDGISWDTR